MREYSYPYIPTSISLTASLAPAEQPDNECSSERDDCHDKDVNPRRSSDEVCKALNKVKNGRSPTLDVRVERVDRHGRIGRCVCHVFKSPFFLNNILSHPPLFVW